MKTLRERFEGKYTPVPEAGCWLWIGAVAGHGRYGSLLSEGRLERAHRVSWELHFGPIPDGMNVCHRCDVGLCVNPAHLFLGTQRENVLDMISKGRRTYENNGRHGHHARGERSGAAKLSDGDVENIRRDYETIHNKAELARRYRISESQIRRIVNNESRYVQ